MVPPVLAGADGIDQQAPQQPDSEALDQRRRPTPWSSPRLQVPPASRARAPTWRWTTTRVPRDPADRDGLPAAGRSGRRRRDRPPAPRCPVRRSRLSCRACPACCRRDPPAPARRRTTASAPARRGPAVTRGCGAPRASRSASPTGCGHRRADRRAPRAPLRPAPGPWTGTLRRLPHPGPCSLGPLAAMAMWVTATRRPITRAIRSTSCNGSLSSRGASRPSRSQANGSGRSAIVRGSAIQRSASCRDRSHPSSVNGTCDRSSTNGQRRLSGVSRSRFAYAIGSSTSRLCARAPSSNCSCDRPGRRRRRIFSSAAAPHVITVCPSVVGISAYGSWSASTAGPCDAASKMPSRPGSRVPSVSIRISTRAASASITSCSVPTRAPAMRASTRSGWRSSISSPRGPLVNVSTRP